MRFLIPATIIFLSAALISCSLILGSYDGGDVITHGYVQGVTPSNSEGFQQRTYNTIQANWNGPGGNKIWLATNLGATREPQNSVDTGAQQAGWLFQFNRKQGYYHNGNNLTPRWSVQSISNNSDWAPENDPCRILLGNNWRVPTIEEWEAFRVAPTNRGGMDEGNRTSAFNSGLKLHAGGVLHPFEGDLRLRGDIGNYWSRNQSDNSNAEAFSFGDASGTFSGNKAFARAVRCIKD